MEDLLDPSAGDGGDFGAQPHEDLNAVLERERREWKAEWELLNSTKNTYFSNVQSLTEELADVQCKLARAEAEKNSTVSAIESERSEFRREIDGLKSSLKEAEDQLAKSRKDASDRISESIKQRSQLESELYLQQNIVQSLQDNVQALQTELQQSRQDMLSAEKVVDDLYSRAEFEAQLKEKDEIIEAKQRALESLGTEFHADSRASSVLNGAGSERVSRSRAELHEELAELRRKLGQKQQEVDYHDSQRRPYRLDDERQQLEDANAERIRQLEFELEEQQTTARNLNEHIDALQKRAAELDRQNTMLIAQFASEFLPAAYEDGMTEEDIQGRFENIQHVIRDNLRLQKQVEELEAKLREDLPTLGSQSLQDQLEESREEAAKWKRKIDDANSQVERLEKSVAYYKMKYEELAVDDSLGANTTAAEAMDTTTSSFFKASADGAKKFRTKLDYEVEIHKLKCELNSLTDRLKNLQEEKQRRERRTNSSPSLHSSKEALELKVQAQTEMVETMEKRLGELDKLNRKLDEQKQKAVVEHQTLKAKFDAGIGALQRDGGREQELSRTTLKRTLETELDGARRELAQLRSRVQMLQDNESVSATVTRALAEFRAAYTKMDSEQYAETKKQLQKVRNDNTTLSDFVKVMHLQQTFAMDKLKTTLSDAQLQRDNYAQKFEAAETQLNALKLEHEDLKERFDSLNRQLTDIDSSDVSLESCRKQIQQLRNKITYLEKTIASTNAQAESWKQQLETSDQQSRTFKQLADSLEKNLHENEEKAMRERNRLQQQADEAAAQLRTAHETIDNLRANISELQSGTATSDAEHAREVAEWKSRIEEVDRQKEQIGMELDRMRTELLTARTEGEELKAALEQVQKTAENEALQSDRDTQSSRAEEYARQFEQIEAERTHLAGAPPNSRGVRRRRTLESDNEALKQQVEVLEKSALFLSGVRPLPIQLPDPALMSNAEATKVVQLIEKLRRERNQEAQLRLQLLSRQQEKLKTPEAARQKPAANENAAAIEGFKASLLRLNAQVEAKDAELKQLTGELERLRDELRKEGGKGATLRDIARRYRTSNEQLMAQMRTCANRARPGAPAAASPAPAVAPPAEAAAQPSTSKGGAAVPSQLFGKSIAAAITPNQPRRPVKRPRIEEPGGEGGSPAPSGGQTPQQPPPQ
ncbi:hypothetical protein M3Y99_00977400 [Aphelenchoides fujianensis]|nr:hypothetical protein M3Y99_00977400 [Aphelenchoides fujianensis]